MNKIFLFLLTFFLSIPSCLALTLTPIVSGLNNPTSGVFLDANGTLLITEQGGRIKLFQNGLLAPEPLLNISSELYASYEAGLLSLVLHPNFSANGRIFITYIAATNDIVIAEYRMTVNPIAIDSNSRTEILRIPHPDASYHYGGQLGFGPDGYLYISTGDGGPQGDPNKHGQSLNTFLGKMLRIDVDSTAPYAIPPTNPFINRTSVKPEIFAYGFRNPWRFSFDSQTGRLFVADVGNTKEEEINIVQRGKNYGWRIREGYTCFKPSKNCPTKGLVDPIFSYTHKDGLAVIGGFIYRGAAIAFLKGKYVFTDFTGGKLWSLSKASPVWKRKTLGSTNSAVSAFVQDLNSELYLLTFEGNVLRIDP